MCLGCCGRVLRPRIGKMEPSYHLGEGPASLEVAGCVGRVCETIEVAPYYDFPIPSL
jgi:hypothetical protein